ncbi:MAG: T9SS type A sorting domain-containing protein [Flavobacteriaceae bacterium]|nr:T9SS type A sorting domain-containing protein [Flavobacteriaceae bacterium]
MVQGPKNGQYIPPPTGGAQLICDVNGVTITTSGSSSSSYYGPNDPIYSSCNPQASFTGDGSWTGTTSTGILVYTFSQPVISATISYSVIDFNDVGTISINSSGIQLSNLCDLNANGVEISSTFPFFENGDVSLTVSSQNPFTTITLTNTGGASGWVAGNPCNFSYILPLTISNCDKVYLDMPCYHETQAQTTTLTVFNNSNNGLLNEDCESCLINGLPCSSTNVIIEPLNTMPYGCYFNTDGTLTIPAGTMPFESEIYYNLRSIQNPTVVSGPYRLNFGILPKALPNTPRIYIENASSANPSYYVNGSVNVLTDSYVRASITGDCDSIITAEIGDLTEENKVTLHELTNPQNPYYYLDTSTGEIRYRGQYSSNPSLTIPTLPERGYQLTYEMCVNHNGVATFCEWAYIDIMYVFANRMANPNHIVKVYPNPSIDGVYTLTFEEKFATATTEVYNLMGILVHQEEVKSSNETKLYLNALPKGTYVLKTTVNNTTYTSKLIKQ